MREVREERNLLEERNTNTVRQYVSPPNPSGIEPSNLLSLK